MQIGTWVQYEDDNRPLGAIIDKLENNKYLIKPYGKIGCQTLVFDVDGYATEYERKNKINRIVEFQP